MLTIISTIASIVSIIGGIVGIWSAFRPRPIYQVPPSQVATPAPQAPSQPTAPRSTSPMPRGQSTPPTTVSRSPAPRSVGFGLLTGLGLSVLSALALLAWQDLWVAKLLIPFASAIGMLAILAGLLPARRLGSMIASTLAGTVLALASVLAVGLHQDIRFPQDPWPAAYWLAGIGLLSVPILIISILAAFVGRALYRRNIRP